ncbi:hypothetical protein TRFO_01648 [Tritrichomonas foetus]|uniref:Uncharacterized protein n=1 Tax=Tritrichomonas foetus TaxID=1144522 RepID=A0A1J4JRL8_9EUKA|nr:hypothetical protein TRFO_01648 [Tritrichomonas foetus]|eukprot:OHT01080.1 hypothetical protein TRFO_01648 [Tritrichomonas foetus]
MCDPAEMVAGLKSDFQQIKQQREKIFDGANAFFDKLFAEHFDFQSEDVVHQHVDFSDDDEESEDEPTRYRLMTMRTMPVFDRKPKKKKPKPLPQELPVELPPPVIIKPITIDKHTQSKKTELKSHETQTSLKSAYKDTAIIATTSAEVQTHSIRLRNEASNTDSVLPSYENVCIAFLESLLEDAPVFLNSGPKPDQIEGILMDFLNQILSDAKNFNDPNDFHTSGSSHQSSGLIKRAKLVDVNIQQEASLQTIATQSPISLKTLETPSVTFNYIPPPKDNYFVGTFMSPAACFDRPPDNRFRMMRVARGDNFAYPPSLRTEPEKPPFRMTTESTSPISNKKSEKATATVAQNKILQMDILDNMNVSVRPDANAGNQSILPPSSFLPPTQQPPQMIPPPLHSTQTTIPQQPPQQQQQQQYQTQQQQQQQQFQTQQQQQQQPPKQDMDVPKLNPLIIKPLEDIEELSNFNLDSFIHDLNSSSTPSEGDDDSDVDSSGRYTGSNSSVNSSMISSVLGSSGYSNEIISSEGVLSSGEVRDFSYLESDSGLSGITGSSESSAPWEWYKK